MRVPGEPPAMPFLGLDALQWFVAADLVVLSTSLSIACALFVRIQKRLRYAKLDEGRPYEPRQRDPPHDRVDVEEGLVDGDGVARVDGGVLVGQ